MLVVSALNLEMRGWNKGGLDQDRSRFAVLNAKRFLSVERLLSGQLVSSHLIQRLEIQVNLFGNSLQSFLLFEGPVLSLSHLNFSF